MTAHAYTVHHGDCLDVMSAMPAGSVHAIVTDPPYGLGFMGKEWDSGKSFVERKAAKRNTFDHVGGNHNPTSSADAARTRRVESKRFGEWCEDWTAECFRVLKPGGHMLAFGGSRTWHRLAAAVEDAGFEIRDSIAWLYGSGFPKSRNLDGDWQGWGTALKPAFEPIVVARKPLAGTVAANVLAHGTGALNIDATRTDMGAEYDPNKVQRQSADTAGMNGLGESGFSATHQQATYNAQGRWPTNVVLDDTQAAELDKQSGTSVSRIGKPRGAESGDGWGMTATGTEYDDHGGASRFFPTFRYEAKAPTDERPRVNGIAHPTVKPLDLMRWLVRLVTPPGGTVLDPFAGSGTTLEAALIEGFHAIGIEREDDYLPLIRARLSKPLETVLDLGALT